MENIANMDTLCRVCSSAGSHSIFGRIPAYCHEHYREYARWKQPIFMLIAEVTGVEITENDGLPKRICVLCISYLKHAYTFRRQAIDNIAGLLTAKYLSNLRPESKKSALDSEQQHVIGRDDIIPTGDGTGYRSVNLANAPSTRSAAKQTTKKPPAMMHRFVAKPPNNNAEEELDNVFGELDEPTSSGLFGYREKEFIEDDVMELDGLQEHGVTFTLPEDYKEKKCFACRKRFMFSETYSQHLTECLLYKLTEAIRALYHIMYLREQSAISAFEFIRRAVFTVRKCYRLVLSYDGELEEDETAGEPTDGPMTDDGEPAVSAIDAKGHDGSPGGFLSRHTYGTIELDSLSDSGSGGSPKDKPSLVDAFRFGAGMNNALSVGSVMGTQPIILRPPDSFVSHTNVDIIKNRLIKSGAEEVNESNVNDRYKTIKCKQCEARFCTISHLDEHTIKVHQRPVRNNPFGL
uniref:ZAD domain-containing protein n=1 Tax=Anopheles coluzzii TaxID=1518534 RepID=A0A6E8W684_ANOCL